MKGQHLPLDLRNNNMEKIAVIEDEKNIRETIQEILEFSGYKVVCAENGKLGVDLILKEKPDLVLCDINMPEIDGMTVLNMIQQRLENEVMPTFLFLTAKVETTEIRRGMDLGADDYLLKPFNPVEILKTIELRLNKRKKILAQLKQHAKKEHSFHSEKLSIPSEDGYELVNFSDIILCSADRAYCKFTLEDGQKILVSKPMKEFEEDLLDQGFFKVHKSSIVNLKYVNKYIRGKGGLLVMKNGMQVAVSSRKKAELLELLKSH